jgi:hypothetical protein
MQAPPPNDSVSGSMLNTIQFLLGDIDTWPSSVLRSLFFDDYDRQSLSSISAFFFGNRVPLHVAFRFYSLCNDHNRLLSLIHFALLYGYSGDPHHDDTCECTFYDVQLKRLRPIHSLTPPSATAAAAADVDVPLGIDATGHGRRIRDRLALFNVQDV